MIAVISPGLGSTGAYLLAAAVRRSGYHVEVLDGSALLWRPTAYYLSVMCVRQLRSVASCLAEQGLQPLARDRAEGDPLVVLGGQYAAQPGPLEPFVDLVCLGDGEITGVEIARRISLRQPKRQICEELDGQPGYALPGRPLTPTYGDTIEPVAIRNGRRGASTVVEIARGCRRRCLFCTVGWAGGPYREVSQQRAVEAGLRQHRANVCYFAPDLSGVSWYSRSRLAEVNTARDGAEWIGLDGASERLRAAIGKRRSDSEIRRWIATDSPGRRRKIYSVIGLPNETEADRAELRALVLYAAMRSPSPVDFSLVPLQFLPHTPFELIDAHDQPALRAWVTELRAELGAIGRDCRAMVFEIKSAESHEHDQVLLRAGPEAAEYLARVPASKSMVRSGRWRELAAPYLDVERLLGADPPRAWDHVHLTDSARLEAVRRCYERKIGKPN